MLGVLLGLDLHRRTVLCELSFSMQGLMLERTSNTQDEYRNSNANTTLQDQLASKMCSRTRVCAIVRWTGGTRDLEMS